MRKKIEEIIYDKGYTKIDKVNGGKVYLTISRAELRDDILDAFREWARDNSYEMESDNYLHPSTFRVVDLEEIEKQLDGQNN